MDDKLDLLIMIIGILLSPLLVHLAATRGVNFYPRKVTGRERVDSILRKNIFYVIMFNGVDLSVAYSLWQFHEGLFWVLPLVIGIPFFLMQLLFALAASYYGAVDRHQRD